MKLTVISDTHMRHEELGALSGDVLIHCGDVLDLFDSQADDLDRVDDWFGTLDFDLILCIGGNHDFALQERKRLRNAVYLEDQSYAYNGVNFYGSPWVPDLPHHAFHADEGTRKEKWALIPEETDVLITHSAPFGTLDQSRHGRKLGCPFLPVHVDRVKPRYHLFGHVHASGGIVRSGSRMDLNASCYANANEPLRAIHKIEI